MSAQPDPVKQNIIDWCQEDNIPCTDSSTENTKFAWTLTLGSKGNHITIYKQSHLDDRIYFQSQIAWAQEHRTLVNQTWNEGQRSAMMFNLKKSSVLYDCNMTFQLNGDELVGINTNKIYFHSTISKSEVLEKFIRMEAIHQVLLNQLNIELGVALQKDKTNKKSDNANMGR